MLEWRLSKAKGLHELKKTPCCFQKLLPAEWKLEFWARRMRFARINRANVQYVRNGELNYSNTWIKNVTNYHNQPIQQKGYHIPPRYHHQDTSLWFASVVLRRVWRNLPSSPPWWKNSKKPMSNSKSKWFFCCRTHFPRCFCWKTPPRFVEIFRIQPADYECVQGVSFQWRVLAQHHTALEFTQTKKYIYIDANRCS